MGKLVVHPSISDLKQVKIVFQTVICVGWVDVCQSACTVVYPSNIFYIPMCIKLVNQVKIKFSVRNILTQFHEITTLQAQTRKGSKIMHFTFTFEI